MRYACRDPQYQLFMEQPIVARALVVLGTGFAAHVVNLGRNFMLSRKSSLPQCPHSCMEVLWTKLCSLAIIATRIPHSSLVHRTCTSATLSTFSQGMHVFG